MSQAIERVTGTVVAYKKGGYAWLDCDGQQIFCHIRDTNRTTLHEGETLECRVVDTPKGPRAKDAIVVETKSTEAAINVHQDHQLQ